MVLRGEALIASYTFNYSIAGQRGDWTITITSPGGVKTEDSTVERTWYPLFTEMLSDAFHAAQKKRFPDRRAEAMPS
jgi:hypothetical protein